MDLASLIGLIMCFGFMILGIVSGPDGVSSLGNFYDLTSIFVTFGGAFMCSLFMTDGIPQYLSNIKSFKLILKTKNTIIAIGATKVIGGIAVAILKIKNPISITNPWFKWNLAASLSPAT